MTDGARSRLLGATICAVPLSQPFPIKNYFKNRLSSKNTVFPRTSAYCRSEKKMASEGGNWPTSFLWGILRAPGHLVDKYLACTSTGLSVLILDCSWLLLHIPQMVSGGAKYKLIFVGSH